MFSHEIPLFPGCCEKLGAFGLFGLTATFLCGYLVLSTGGAPALAFVFGLDWTLDDF
jgi:hypothetical protein